MERQRPTRSLKRHPPSNTSHFPIMICQCSSTSRTASPRSTLFTLQHPTSPPSRLPTLLRLTNRHQQSVTTVELPILLLLLPTNLPLPTKLPLQPSNTLLLLLLLPPMKLSHSMLPPMKLSHSMLPPTKLHPQPLSTLLLLLNMLLLLLSTLL